MSDTDRKAGCHADCKDTEVITLGTEFTACQDPNAMQLLCHLCLSTGPFLFERKRNSWYCECRNAIRGENVLDRFVRAEDVDGKRLTDQQESEDVFMAIHPQTGARFLGSKQYQVWKDSGLRGSWKPAYEAFCKELSKACVKCTKEDKKESCTHLNRYKDYYDMLERKQEEKDAAAAKDKEKKRKEQWKEKKQQRKKDKQDETKEKENKENDPREETATATASASVSASASASSPATAESSLASTTATTTEDSGKTVRKGKGSFTRGTFASAVVAVSRVIRLAPKTSRV